MNEKQVLSHLSESALSAHKRAAVFKKLSYKEQAHMLNLLDSKTKKKLLDTLKNKEIVPPLEHLDPDEATNALKMLPPKRQKKIIEELSKQLKEGIQVLSQFDPETAAGLMNLDYIQIEQDDVLSSVIKKFKEHEARRGRPPTIIVIKKNEITGYLPGYSLGIGKHTDKVKKFTKNIPTIQFDADHDEVLQTFKDNPHNQVVVLGDIGNVLGIIYSDDILRVMEEQKSASLYDFAGVHDEEGVSDGMMIKVHSRYKWLIINLGTAFLAAFTVGLFEPIITKYVLLAVYMPIVAGMGGNAATQTLAVVVRGIALKQIDLKSAWHTLKNEIGASVINGLINGIIVAAIVLIFNRDWKIAIILGFAMIFNLLVAALFGTIVPLIMQKLGKDPATSATIFITTATDVLGFMAFLGLATLILGM
ncbi:MAG: magnesium transporter [Candidatus Gracilibacteria bacterium]